MSRNSISIYLSVLSAFAVNFFNREGAKNAKRFFFRLICVSSFIRFLTGGALVLFAFNAPAQDRVFQYSPGAHLTEFMEYCYFLTDSARFNADEPPLDADFISAAKVDFDQLPDRYWMKFSIQNREDRQVNLQLFIGLSEKMFFYVPGSEKYEAYSIGTFESRSIAKQISGVGKTFLSQALVTLEPGQTQTFYAWFHHLSKGVQASRDAKISPLLIDEQIWVKNNNISNTIWDIIFGSFLILILYHFVYYFLTRDSVYLYYCFFVFSAAFPFLTLVRDVADNPAYNALMFFSVSGLFSVFYFQLARKFISLRELLPRWDKILRYYIVGKTAVVALYCILHLFTKDIFVILAIYIPAILLELVLMILLAVALVKTKDRISVIYVVGSSLAWAGILLSIILADPEMNFTPQMKPYHFGMPAYGFVLESLFFAMALAYRAKLNEIEKKQAKDALIKQLQENKTLQEKVNRELEEKVVERTKDIELERQKSEKLLLNVLPQTIVEEMKATGTTIPKRFNNVSVLIADFVGFTAIAEKLSPEELVRRLDHFSSVSTPSRRATAWKRSRPSATLTCAHAGCPIPTRSTPTTPCAPRLSFRIFWRSTIKPRDTASTSGACASASSPGLSWRASSATTSLPTTFGATPSTPPRGWSNTPKAPEPMFRTTCTNWSKIISHLKNAVPSTSRIKERCRCIL
jgi:hypothetical protein